jgi:hypothetical protein
MAGATSSSTTGSTAYGSIRKSKKRIGQPVVAAAELLRLMVEHQQSAHDMKTKHRTTDRAKQLHIDSLVRARAIQCDLLEIDLWHILTFAALLLLLCLFSRISATSHWSLSLRCPLMPTSLTVC